MQNANDTDQKGKERVCDSSSLNSVLFCAIGPLSVWFSAVFARFSIHNKRQMFHQQRDSIVTLLILQVLARWSTNLLSSVEAGATCNPLE
jgi:hypothetical protein